MKSVLRKEISVPEAPATEPESAPSEREQEERRLLSRIARFQDSKALEQIYNAYRGRVVSFMSRFVQNPASLEEIYDDVMWVVWNKAAQFDGRSKVSTWIFAIAYRKAIRTFQKESRRREVGGEAWDLATATIADEPSGVSLETRNLIESALEQLSPDHRLTVELSYFSDLTYSEIADIAGVPENTIKTRMFHARRKLQTIVEELS